MKSVFIIGTQRSGSNLLRLMLNQLKEIASPHPPHILDRMIPLMGTYGDLKDDAKFKTLVDDVCRLVELNPVEWSDVTFDREKIFTQSENDRSLMSVYKAVYDTYAEHQNAHTWCCKSMANINYIDSIEAHFEQPKYIYLYRDGRDVALSFQKAVVGEKHMYNIAKDWADTQEIAVNLRSSIESEFFYSVSYEQLTQQPEETAQSLCKFLGVEFSSDMFDFHKSSEAKNAADSSDLWGNVTSPIQSNNSKKYKKEMSEDDIRIFESVAGKMLDQLNYERDFVAIGEETQYTAADIEAFNAENKRQKLAQLLNVNEEDKKRRQRQAGLLEEIKSRKVA
ncbi:Sulfotransferase domain protein [hydrothermal vent metagenome]|uniref:Sulfotransferase domain protein n=1 Tax=hydrothermal vent metagenome TaxID=652676 RepID=A0A3B0Y852_9ZZZZ